MDGLTPLHSAAAEGHSDMVRLLVAAGADQSKVIPRIRVVFIGLCNDIFVFCVVCSEWGVSVYDMCGLSVFLSVFTSRFLKINASVPVLMCLFANSMAFWG